MITKAIPSSHVTYYLASLLWVHLLCSGARADLIAYTSFEEPSAISGHYVDTQDPSTDHELSNNPGEPLVYWSKSAELGFSSFYTNTRNSTGLGDGDFVGVITPKSPLAAFHGTQVFQMEDTDGLMTTYLTQVDLFGYANPSISLNIHAADTGWESDDGLHVWLILNGITERDLLNIAGDDIEDFAQAETWHQLNDSLTGYDSATLAFSLDSNSGSESILIDNIRFEGDKAPVPAPVPVPASSILGGLGLAYANWLRRRFKA